MERGAEREEVSWEQNVKEGPTQLGTAVDPEETVRIYRNTKSLNERMRMK